MNPEHKHDAIVQGIASVPSWGAIGVYLLGVPIEKWAALVGLLFIGLQALYLLWKWRRDIRREDERRKRGEAPPTTDNGAL